MAKGEYYNETLLIVLKTCKQTVKGMKMRSRKPCKALDMRTSRQWQMDRKE